MVLCAMACLIDQLWNQRALRQMPPEAAGQVLFERARINARRIEGAAVVGLPQRLSFAVRLRGPDLPLARAVAMMVQALAIPVHAVCRRGNQPALLAQALAEVPAGPGENVMARLEPGQQVHLASGGCRLKAHKGVQVVCLAAYGLDASLQFAAVRVASQSRTALAMHNTP